MFRCGGRRGVAQNREASACGRGIPDRFGGRDPAQRLFCLLPKQSVISVPDQPDAELVAQMLFLLYFHPHLTVLQLRQSSEDNQPASAEESTIR
jgi:hypothetical protein